MKSKDRKDLSSLQECFCPLGTQTADLQQIRSKNMNKTPKNALYRAVLILWICMTNFQCQQLHGPKILLS